MKNKRGLVVLILSIILIALVFIFTYLIYHFYFKESPEEELVDIPLNETDNCPGLEDSYVLPDFQKFESRVSKEQIVRDVPPKAKISLKFFHLVEDCKKQDKIYLLRDGKIEERNIESDIEIRINSDYAEKMVTDDLCKIISEAREKGDLEQSVNVGSTKLMWAYKNMLEYKECLGL